MAKEALDKVLANVNNGRRGFLKRMLLGGGAAMAVLPLINSTAMGQDTGTDTEGKKKKKKKKSTDTTSLR